MDRHTARMTTQDSVFRKDIFRGKVAFVTGGGSGICKGVTRMLLEHGASAVILGRRKANIEDAAAELSKATGRKCLGIQADVRQLETLEAAVKQTVAELGRIDFVVAGAAGNFLAPIDGLSSNAFRTVLEIDTIGTYNTFKRPSASCSRRAVRSRPSRPRCTTRACRSRPTFRRPRRESTLSSESSPSNTVREAFEPTASRRAPSPARRAWTD